MQGNVIGAIERLDILLKGSFSRGAVKRRFWWPNFHLTGSRADASTMCERYITSSNFQGHHGDETTHPRTPAPHHLAPWAAPGECLRLARPLVERGDVHQGISLATEARSRGGRRIRRHRDRARR